MVVPFAQWVDEAHGVTFSMEDATFANALKRKECGTPLEAAEVWPLLDGFFSTQMHRQRPIAGALEAMGRLSAVADIVVLTNVGPEHQAARRDQLAAFGLNAPVIGSRGPKGVPVEALVAQLEPSVILFIDDLGQHHRSVREVVPDAWRLHFVGEPVIAAKVGAAIDAHARIDDWPSAEAWIRARLAEGPAAG